jgi:AcrR family transcriptional regulator
MAGPRSETGSEAPRPPGRPRSERAHRAILDATLELLGETGYEGLTMEGIAARAGVGKATVYRRWRSREEVMTAAVEDFVSDIDVPDTGSVEEDLLHLMRRAVSVYLGPPGRILPGLVSAMARDPDLARSVREGFLESRRSALATVLERGLERGELRDGIDLELTLDFLGGPLFYRLLVTGGPVDRDLGDGVVDVLLRGIGAVSEARPAGREA